MPQIGKSFRHLYFGSSEAAMNGIQAVTVSASDLPFPARTLM